MKDLYLEIPKIFQLWIPIEGYFTKLDHWTEISFLFHIMIFFFGFQIQLDPFLADGGNNLAINVWFMPKWRPDKRHEEFMEEMKK